jgi:nitrous oxidase accessory protein NosD
MAVIEADRHGSMRIVVNPPAGPPARLAPGRRPQPATALFLLLSCVLVLLAGCADRSPSQDAARRSGHAVLQVPGEFGTIQAAVDVARPGDLVLIHPGVYHESVRVITPDVVLRGTDRDTVVLDGRFLLANGITATGAGSAVENLTVRDYQFNGVLFTGVTDQRLQQAGAGGSEYNPLDTAKFPEVVGFRASYVTAYDNGLYGIYAFDARNGVIEDSYSSGQADSGIYVGQCRPCATELRGNTLRHNAVGVEITNASEGVYVLGNLITGNRVGLTVQSDDLEALAPQHGAVVSGNVISGNNEPQSPEQADGGFGIGVGIGGGTGNQISRNLIAANSAVGVEVADVPGYRALDNTVTGNRTDGNGVDLVLNTPTGSGNCFAGNSPASQSPARLEQSAPCGGAAAAGGALPPGRAAAVTAPPGVSFELLPAPPAQPQLPGAAHAPARAAVGLPGAVDPQSYPLPRDPAAMPQPVAR